VSSKSPGLWKRLGAGLITGASDDDPSGIGTYAQAGAAWGFQLGWTLVLTYPLMVAIQAISARIGRTTGHGIAGNLRQHYPNVLLQAIVALLLAANILNIGADLGAMAACLKLLLPRLPAWVGILVFAFLCTSAQVVFSHERYVSILKWLTLALLAYFAVLAVLHIQWSAVIQGLVWPRWSLDRELWLMVVAILGTTISPYLFFWQAGQEVEDTKAHPDRVALSRQPSQAPVALARIKLDTLVGMGISNLVGLAIVITAGATLYPAGIREITTAAEAAQALRPLAGRFAASLFSLGLIGAGLLAVPVLAGSAAYALGEARRWPVGLSRRPLEAKAFYATIAVATLLGALANTLSMSPMRALVWAAVINGLVAVPVMTLLVLMASSARVMGQFRISLRLRILGWTATVAMALAGLGLALSATGSG
jgi:NRAMP (natural resistance-associated macrophage protein)-like metal ion transporter